MNHVEYISPSAVVDHNGYVVGDLFIWQAIQRPSYFGPENIEPKKLLRSIFLTPTLNMRLNQPENHRSLGLMMIMTTQKGNEDLFNGAWSVYPFFKSGNLIVSDINEGLLCLKYSVMAKISLEKLS